MKTYKKNAVMAGALYFLGTAFGITAAVVGGKVLSSIVTAKPLSNVDLLALVASNSTQLNAGAFFTLLMGISLVAMTAFLYPIFKKDSEELALGMLLFRGALEGTWYLITMLNLLVLVAVSKEYVSTGANSTALQSIGNVVYQFQDLLAPVGTLVFLIGASCLYISFYRTKLIPRWLTIWGFIGVIPYLAYVILHYFHLDNGIGFYLQMILAPQEIVMAIWLIVKGFNQKALAELLADKNTP